MKSLAFLWPNTNFRWRSVEDLCGKKQSNTSLWWNSLYIQTLHSVNVESVGKPWRSCLQKKSGRALVSGCRLFVVCVILTNHVWAGCSCCQVKRSVRWTNEAEHNWHHCKLWIHHNGSAYLLIYKRKSETEIRLLRPNQTRMPRNWGSAPRGCIAVCRKSDAEYSWWVPIMVMK